jgi:hypothetical protein
VIAVSGGRPSPFSIGRMVMPLPTTLMPWISIFAAGLSAAISRSASRPLLVTVKYPPAVCGAAREVRAQGRLMSMVMPPLSH